MTIETILEGRGLTHGYRLGSTRVSALSGVDIDVRCGEFLCLVGPSGSGKTTLVNLLGLLDRPEQGSVRLCGKPVEGLDEEARADLRRDRYGFVFQTFNLVLVLTAQENVEYPMMLKGLPAFERRRRARELLSQVGLAGKFDVRPDHLSGGERQRVAVARALANEPDLILADEPTANLDSRTAEGVLDLVESAALARGMAVVLATHDPRVMARAHRVVSLRDGVIVEAG